METQAVTVQEQQATEPIAEKRLTVFARNPQEMSIAQAQLVKWTLGKMGEIHGEQDDLRENLAVAEKNGWRTVTLKRQLARTAKRMVFYEKVKAALEAGYCIVPNFPIDVFAIRTAKGGPDRPGSGPIWNRRPWQQHSESPQLGDGEFKSATAKTESHQELVKHEAGKEPVYRTVQVATDWQDIDFPFAFAQPAVLEATQQAIADRLFDELGVSPARRATRRIGGGDPMVIGRIYAPSSGYNRDTRCLSFVVAWFLRPDRDLDF